MNCYESLRAVLRPHQLHRDTLNFLLENNELLPDSEYNKAEMELNLMKSLVDALYQVKTLIEESDPGSKHKYGVTAIDDRIRRIQDKYNLSEDTSNIEDATHTW